MTMKSTVQIMLVIIVPNQMLNMNTQWSFFFSLQQEKPILIRTPQPESKTLKRKILVSDSPPQLDEDDRKTTPKRKKPLLNSEMSPTHHGSTPVSKTPSSGITSPRTGPLSERQQMLFLMKMTDDSQGLYYWFHQRMFAIKLTFPLSLYYLLLRVYSTCTIKVFRKQTPSLPLVKKKRQEPAAHSLLPPSKCGKINLMWVKFHSRFKFFGR